MLICELNKEFRDTETGELLVEKGTEVILLFKKEEKSALKFQSNEKIIYFWVYNSEITLKRESDLIIEDSEMEILKKILLREI